MYSASSRFFSVITGPHYVVTRAELLIDGEVALNLTNEGVVTDGNVNVQTGGTDERSGNLSLVDRDGTFSPTRPDDLLAPVGNEIRLWRGVQYTQETSELMPLGTFRFTATRGQYPAIEMDLYDRSWVVSGAKLETPLLIRSGTNCISAIIQILTTAYGPDLIYEFPTTDEVTPSMIFEAEADPWQIARELTANIGMQLYFDQLGVCKMRNEIEFSQAVPVWTFDDADVRNIALPGGTVAWDSTDAFNAVIIIGENSSGGASYRGVAYDSDPSSPTYYNGRFGKRPIFIRDEKIGSQQQATLRARIELLRQLGLAQSITVPSLVNPALEPADIVRVIDRVRGIDQLAICDKFALPLRADGTMAIERSRKVPTAA